LRFAFWFLRSAFCFLLLRLVLPHCIARACLSVGVFLWLAAFLYD
jgi:hypothetical protein